MKTIWKQPLLIGDKQEAFLPRGAKVLCAQVQDNLPAIWFECDSTAEKTTCFFSIYGTGHRMPEDPGNYVDTFQLHDGKMVFHLYEWSPF